MAISTHALGTTGMQITCIGLGSWAIGGGGWVYAWGAQDDAESIAAIRSAIDRGINWVDTAAVYGLGHSEQVVAAALRGFGEDHRPFVFTKCGLAWDADHPMAPTRRVGRPEVIRRQVDESLQRLGVERIDLMQMHWPSEDGTRVEDYWGTLVELRQEGKLRAAGLSNHSVSQLAAAEAIGHVDTMQPPLSMIRREAAADVIPACAAQGTGVIVYSPMQAGLLTGSFSPERVAGLAEDDWRRTDPEFTTNLERNLDLVEALRPIAERYETSLAAIAVAWTLSVPGVSGAIVGARSGKQVDDWLAAGCMELDGPDLAEIAKAIEAGNVGGGPVPA